MSTTAEPFDTPPRRVLPMHLPARPRLKPVFRRCQYRTLARATAWFAAEWLVTTCNYFELGSPKTEAEYQEALGPYHVTSQAESLFKGLVDRLVESCRSSACEGWTRGRKMLLETIVELSNRRPEEATSPASYELKPLIRRGSRCQPGRL